MIDSKSGGQPASRRVLRRIGAVLAGMILIVTLDIGLDVIMHATGIYPPWFQPMATGLWLLAIRNRVTVCVYRRDNPAATVKIIPVFW
ncbi:MAG TPA: hypothetical protein VHQ64_13745 [Pyrinomonadaceae bacterium]|jgi:hypothetical protein|nr:hypothetical protein [Pyrinomonadaceae bacterium]